MAKYHINPRTGLTSACGARANCPFGSMLTDHYATREAAQAAYEARMKGEVFPSSARGSGSVSHLTPELREAWGNGDVKAQDQVLLLVERDLADDDVAFVGRTVGDHSVIQEVILVGPNKNISLETRKAALLRNRNYHLAPAVIENENFPVLELLGSMSEYQLRQVSRYSRDAAVLDELAEEACRRSVERPLSGEADGLAVAVVRNSHLSDVTLARVVAVNETAGRFMKLKRLQATHMGDFDNLVVRKVYPSKDNSREGFQLDVGKVAELGLSPADVDTWVRYVKGEYLFEGNYDLSTGVYSGFPD